jgi:hypothetical protein
LLAAKGPVLLLLVVVLDVADVDGVAATADLWRDDDGNNDDGERILVGSWLCVASKRKAVHVFLVPVVCLF